MKNIIVVLVTTLLFFCFSVGVIAGGWSTPTKVSFILAVDGNRVLVKLDKFTNPDGCKIDSRGDLYLDADTHKIWLSLLLSAQMSEKYVDIYSSASCTAVWSGTSYSDIGHVKLLTK